MNSRHSLVFLGFLLILTISDSLAINFYLALLPTMAEDLSTSAAEIQQTVSVYLMGFAGAQLIVEPLSDRFGRKIILLVCYSVFIVASLVCALATDVSLLIGARFVQSLGGCAGVLLSRVIVKDIYPPEEMGKVMSYMTMGFSMAPLLAPAIGGFVGVTFGWRSLFYILFAFGLVLIVWTLFGYRESNKNLNPDAIRIKHLFNNYASLLKEPKFVGYSLAVCSSIAGILTYTSASSFILIKLLGVPTTVYGFLFSVSAFGMFLGSIMAVKLNARIGSASTVFYGALVLSFGGVIMAILPWLGVVSVTSIVAPMFLYALGNGVVMPTAMSLAIMPFPKMAGSAAAWIGCCQAALGALCGYIVSLLYNASAIPMTSMIGLLSIIALVSILTIRFKFQDSE
ncbi:multidrug effflux MFS transporter [Marinomonas sp. GJ51-6]|uniref:multidrug effflux MFS transporter n=1 Tax=Marinomonas sp. GJ51-6 TaxID=2992802 RepID=UPI002934BC5C|nr:multidrug effflux MFS transporter [Marinomonas sp. GJ51-6]WOD08597.1 multidrug effflux MFS transporter [Marinomonas sp. GJ51-6]